MKAKTKLTYKQKQFTRKYVEHNGNATQAALEVYDSNYDSAQVLGSRNTSNPLVMQEIDKLLTKKGLNNDEWIASSLKTALESGLGVKANNADSIKILDMLLKVKNSYPKNVNKSIRLNLSQDLSHINVVDATKTLKELDKTTKAILEDLQS